jgi:hypothetical protein
MRLGFSGYNEHAWTNQIHSFKLGLILTGSDNKENMDLGLKIKKKSVCYNQ